MAAARELPQLSLGDTEGVALIPRCAACGPYGYRQIAIDGAPPT
jgi:hypothetical protein